MKDYLHHHDGAYTLTLEQVVQDYLQRPESEAPAFTFKTTHPRREFSLEGHGPQTLLDLGFVGEAGDL